MSADVNEQVSEGPTEMSSSEGTITIDQTVPTEPTSPEAPSVPDKFRNADGSVNTDALLKSYTELEKMKSSPAPEVEPKEGLEIATPVKTEAIQKAVGTELFKEIAEYYGEHQEISEDLYTKLNEKGFDKPFTDAWIEGQKSLRSKYESSVKAEAGGEEQYAEMITWAQEGLTEAERLMYDEAVDSKDPVRAKMAVGFLKSRYISAEGKAPQLVEGSAPNATEGFRSEEEFAQAINDPRWQKDVAFTRAIMDRLKVSSY